MISAFANTWKVPELRDRILFTLAMIIIVRLGVHITLPGVDSSVIERWTEHASKDGKSKGARHEGEPSPLEPPLKSAGAAKSAVSARHERAKWFRWRKRVASGQTPEPSEKDAPTGPLP